MNYRTYSFRFGYEILTTQPEFISQWNEIQYAIKSISDNDIINHFESMNRQAKSISETLNKLLKVNFQELGWQSESPIYKSKNYSGDKTWRLDFAKKDISIEVGFNHGEAIAWNLVKPTLAGELNHVEKAIQTKVCVIITATQSLKEAGGFDSTVGTYEKYLQYLEPLRSMLTIPTLIIGLEKPTSFYIEHINEGTAKNKRYVGKVILDEAPLCIP